MMHEYKLPANFFAKHRIRVLVWTLIISSVAAAIGIRVGLRRVQRSWASYRLILDENSIRRVQDGYPEITIQSSEISKINETEGRGLVIHSMRPYTYIGIPRAVEEYSEIRSDLAKKHTIESISRTRGKIMQVLTLATGLLAPVAFGIIFLATNKYVIVVTGILVFIGLLVSVVVILRSGSTSKQVKEDFLAHLTVFSSDCNTCSVCRRKLVSSLQACPTQSRSAGSVRTPLGLLKPPKIFDPRGK